MKVLPAFVSNVIAFCKIFAFKILTGVSTGNFLPNALPFNISLSSNFIPLIPETFSHTSAKDTLRFSNPLGIAGTNSCVITV